jgi:hypothetical protein
MIGIPHSTREANIGDIADLTTIRVRARSAVTGPRAESPFARPAQKPAGIRRGQTPASDRARTGRPPAPRPLCETPQRPAVPLPKQARLFPRRECASPCRTISAAVLPDGGAPPAAEADAVGRRFHRHRLCLVRLRRRARHSPDPVGDREPRRRWRTPRVSAAFGAFVFGGF